jgi:DNA replication and repair protein RecF
MHISKLRLKNFRSHSDLKQNFNEDLNLIIGPNGSGKTNMLEAIYVLSNAKSNRARYDRDMVSHEQDFCTINGFITSDSDAYELEVQIIKDKKFENSSIKKVMVNKVAKGQKAFNSKLNTVLFSPEDINIVTGTPSIRRRYMDIVIGQIDYEYKRALSQYIKSLRQRNRVLEMIRDENRGHEQLGFWTEKIVEHGQKLNNKRAELIEYIGTELKNNSTLLKKGLKINYLSSEINNNRLEEYKNKEIAAKNTLIGPHRDDFEILYENYTISEFGSRGQQRSAVLSLKLAEIEFVNSKSGERPVLLLDDIFSELDEDHKKEVNKIINKQQTIITSAEEMDQIAGDALIIRL